jgi:toxin FitB
MNVVDSSGWIEYFIDSAAAAHFAPIIEKTRELIVPTLSLLEVHRFLSRHARAAERDHCLELMRRAKVIDLTASRAINASHLATKHRFAMADAVMYSIALEFDATFWTQDVGYKGLANVRYSPKPR